MKTCYSVAVHAVKDDQKFLQAIKAKLGLFNKQLLYGSPTHSF